MTALNSPTAKTALLVIDVQQGVFTGHKPVADWPRRCDRIAALIARARATHHLIAYAQHIGGRGSRLAPDAPGWPLDKRLDVREQDLVIHKTASDSFFGTSLHASLQAHGITDVVVCGCWTNYCVDTTCRRAISLGYNVQLASDAHACGNSPTLSAEQIIAHHNHILDGFAAGSAQLVVRPAAEIQFA
jgi:nicotinamidase-related amidase